MRLQRVAPLGLFALFLIGCDTGGPRIEEGDGTIQRRFDSPILFGLETGDENLCVGQEIQLLGVNFSSNLEENRVNFRFSNARIPGLPTRVEFPTDGNPNNGLESRLRVVVPTGVSSGNVELEVDGVFAGAAGYFACPQIFSYGIGLSGMEPVLRHAGLLGFDPNTPPIDLILFGINFGEVTRILVRDSKGGPQIQVPLNQINLRPILNPPANNLDQIGFSFENLTLSVEGQRDNIFVQVATPKFTSNEIQVPVQNFQSQQTSIGAAINGVVIPPGVRTGSVPIFYSMYDNPVIDQAFSMDIQWTVNGGETWFPALPVPNVDDPQFGDTTDPLHDGSRAILPGSVNFGSPAGIFFAGGALRTFTWDAQNDENFIALTTGTQGPRGSVARNFIVNFKLHPVPETAVQNKPGDSNHQYVSPPVAYYDVEDRGQVDFSSQREGIFRENFSDTSRRDPQTTARWGPPFNVNALRGEIPALPAPPVGTGQFDLVMERMDPPPAFLIEEYFVVDTNIMQINHIVAVDQDNDPNTPVNRTETALTLFPTLDIPNPGERDGEFHVRTLFVQGPNPNNDDEDYQIDEDPIDFDNSTTPPTPIDNDGDGVANEDPPGDLNGDGCPGGCGVDDDGDGWVDEGMEVRLVGDNPVVFRVSGSELTVFDVTVAMEGIMHANGEDGDNGGGSRCGGGRGGAGASLGVGGAGDVSALTVAEDGGNQGGGGGNTPGAVDPNLSATSRFKGAPGGGGGNRTPGGAGDPGPARNPGNFSAPRGGHGGQKRGSGYLVPLSPGSGGGGGGATISRAAGATPNAVAGATGGGGGGAIQITAHGSMVITGLMQVNGGDGGNGGQDGAAGGGGSGGCILLQSSGIIDVACQSLEANGGQNGTATFQNSNPGSGDGGEGWIRVEPRFGGGPFCNSLAAETTLVDRITTSTSTTLRIRITDATGFPTRGVVFIEDEAVEYRNLTISGTNNTLEDLTRGIYGTTIVAHNAGARVILESPIFPPDGLVRSPVGFQINQNPDLVVTGLGSDGILHADFVETIDPNTGEPLVDPVTGNRLSVWTIDTETGVVSRPDGSLVLTAVAAKSDPGLFSFSRLRIDVNVILRALGSKPLRIRVTEIADIAGKLDISGFNGGALEFDVNNLAVPDPGQGGRPGPGGGTGGAGGSFIFLDGNVGNKDPANTLPVPAQWGGLPEDFPSNFDRTGATSGSVPPPDDLFGLETTRATPGDPILTQDTCGGTPINPCTGGGGGGGGSRMKGTDGKAQPGTSVAFGRGGSPFGLDSFRFGGGLFLLGGQGGAGGGPSVDVSQEYRNGQAGNAVFKAAAKFAPGTGGGGGGGILHLAVQGALILRSTGGIIARGGNAYQSIDLAGNGGAGGGGAVLIQLANSLTIEPGAIIDVRGGVANQPPPALPGQFDPLYEGNIRRVGTSTRKFGGDGGNGAIGRVRIEVPPGSNLLSTAFNDNIISSVNLPDIVPSIGVSRAFTPGVSPGKMALSQMMIPENSILRFADQAVPDGTDAFLMWRGARPSLDVHGMTDPILSDTPSPLNGLVEGIQELPRIEYLQFVVQILSNGITRESPTITGVELPYRLGNPREE